MNKIYKTYLLLRNNLKQIPKDRFGAILDSHSFFDAIIDNHNVLFIEADCYDPLEIPLTASFEPYSGSDFIFNVDIDDNPLVASEIINYVADEVTTKVYIDNNFIDVNANIFNSFYGDHFMFDLDNSDVTFTNTYYLETYPAKKFNTKIDNIILEDEFSAVLVSGWYDHFSFNLAHWIVIDEFEARLIPASTYTFEFFFDERLKQEATFKVDDNTAELYSLDCLLNFPVYTFKFEVTSYAQKAFNTDVYVDFYEIHQEAEAVSNPADISGFDSNVDFNINMTTYLEITDCVPVDLEFVDIIVPYFSDNYFFTFKDSTARYLEVLVNTNTLLETYIDLSNTPLHFKYDFKIREFTQASTTISTKSPTNIQAKADSNSHAEAYFIYCTDAKLSDYNESINTLDSMGISTLEELTYYKHVYN